MFLEELKNEDGNNFYRNTFSNTNNHKPFSPSDATSMNSSANLEIIKIQEESFSKIHNDIT
jgi:hypothetical protein